MESYNFWNRSSSLYSNGPPTAATDSSSFSMYPKIGQQHPGQLGPPPARPAPSPRPNPFPNSSVAPSSYGLGIRVRIKPDYRITPPPPLAPLMGEIPRSTFQFDFDLEKKLLAEAEKGGNNWSEIALENQATKASTSTSTSTSMKPAGDPIVNKYVAAGLAREATSLAVQNYGDNPVKVREFVKGYNLLREMGFSSKNVAEALAMYDNDTDKALAYFLNSA